MEAEGEFQDLLNKLGIKRKRTRSHTPQHNGVAERSLGLQRDKTVALLSSLKEGKSDRLWAEATQYAFNMILKSATSSVGRGLTPYKLWYGQQSSVTGILPFGTGGYFRRHNPPHRLAPRGDKSILLGPMMNRLSLAYQVRDLTIESVYLLQSVVWHTSKTPAHDGLTAAKPGWVGGLECISTHLHAGR